MLKGYRKKKREIFLSPNAFWGAKPAKNKEKNVKKMNFRFNHKRV